ncbi:FAD-dependent oxidoreductase [Streptomyces bacillaris]|uniref:FAD-dependent oxidoreductase n=1 Tax=Streptomyces cavourensis TaxID=67258 RepID=A0ABY5F9J4_9ACTN|nr:FAD-dependent oxidoreductase [Streptomyces cavourensis]UTR80399.1 FAD-dependent oxidoreductase [Streptomyces cavourensis]WAE64707.1 FAD-dependent oxidoreductase [Streptomyces cavourensis]
MRELSPEPEPERPAASAAGRHADEAVGRAGEDAQIIVVGAGPAGSSAAYHLARAGVDVILLEKARFPREKVCGDGLTPRAVHQLIRMGVDISAPGWIRSRGMRWVAGEHRVHIDWPALGRYPDFGLSRSRHDFDDILARHAVVAGARLFSGWKAEAPLTDRAGRVTGVTARSDSPDAPDSPDTPGSPGTPGTPDASGPRTETDTGAKAPARTPVEFRAPVVIAADGASARLALALGLERDPRRQIATAARRYYHSPERSQEEYLELWADLRFPDQGPYLPGYGWIFPMGDGRVNVGLGALPHRRHGKADLRATLDQWLARTPEEWGLREENAQGPVRSAALPLGFNRHPLYARGLLLVGDSGGMVSPWNGEGIAQALEAGEVAAETAALALAHPEGPRREQVLRGYPVEMNHRWGRHYRLGNAAADLVFSRSGFQPVLNRYVMNSPFLLNTLARLLTDLTDKPSRDVIDHVLNTAFRVVPAPKPGRAPGRRLRPGPGRAVR